MTIFLTASAAALATTVLLVAALLLAERENRRAHVLGELAASLELDDVMTRTLEAARLLPGVDAARVSIANGSGEVVADDGLTAEDEFAPALAADPESRRTKLVRLAAAQDEEEADAAEGLLREALVVPLTNGDEHIGHLGAYARTAGGPEPARAQLEELAQRAAPI